MHHASICANVVIGALVVLCGLHVTRVVVVDAVVRLTLGLIAHVVFVVFVVVILQRIFCIWRYTLYIKDDSSPKDSSSNSVCVEERRLVFLVRPEDFVNMFVQSPMLQFVILLHNAESTVDANPHK